MKPACLCAVLLLAISGYGQAVHRIQDRKVRTKPLDVVVDRFDLTDAIIRDGVSQLSLKNIPGLHLGLEEIILQRIQDDARTQSTPFSLHLQGKTVRKVLDELCRSDMRYTWSKDGSTVNIYPRATADDSSYLLNLWIEKIAVANIADPDHGLTPLWRLFPHQQIGYSGPGLGDNTYATPWTASFERLTVRQFINRLAEHMGPQTSWVWAGGNQARFFTFLKGGFRILR